MFEDLRQAKMICIDVETFDPNLKSQGPGTFRKDGWLVGVAIKPDDGPPQYYPIGHTTENYSSTVVKTYLQDQLGTDIPKLGARILYDLEWLHWLGVKVNGLKYDVQIAEALLDENRFRYNLEDIAQRRLGEGKAKDGLLIEAQRINPKIKTHSDVFKVFNQLHPDTVTPYVYTDVELPFKIFKQQQSELANQDLFEVFKVETELIDLLLQMRIKGVPVDIKKAEKVRLDLIQHEQESQAKLNHLAGSEIGVWNAEQISKAFDKNNIPYPRTPKTNKPSFTAPWLESHSSELAQLLVQTRRISKMRNDFIENMILKSAIDGRIHPQFHSMKHDSGGTVSGRFSSSDPNLQQVPARDPVFGPLIRGIFVPDPGFKWCKGDYSQQEPRVTVHYAYLRKFKGADIAVQRYLDNPDTDYHQLVADLCEIERRPAKDINLGLAYGMGIKKMAEKLGLSVERTKQLYIKYHAGVPFVKFLADDCMRLVETRGYIKTILGRRRHFNLWSPNSYDMKCPPLHYDEAVEAYGLPLKRAFTHKALNSLIQGTSADMIKKAMLDYFKAGYIPYLTVHDEIDAPVKNKKQAEELRDIMINAVKLEVPLKVDLFIEKSWGDCK